MGAGSLKITRSLLEETRCYFRHWDQHVPISFPGTFEAMVVWRKVKHAYCQEWGAVALHRARRWAWAARWGPGMQG